MSDSAASPVVPRTAAGLRRRQTGSSTAARSSTSSRPAAGPGGMLRIYTDDSPGIKVDPVTVLVGSLTFIASVFILHIVGKYTR
ncbi:transporter Sec61 subunit beta [Fimicolochytrium jonesii]|uniref:transporter Sec61 subunit beta n=1 Tax=Fimicolochytrium jonesii TaxID=1396493 RepID=UPI0022FE7A27|nr:transporter Sec61 subunit beta [Fimicolochytrium jonesii]KAI8817801.1 transporter Sec61 subunit beta [Fimicolochytrium jonesii]